jgi:hypothetical protein
MSIEDVVDRVLENSEKLADRLEKIIAEEFKGVSTVEVIITLESLSASMTAAFLKSLISDGDKRGAEVLVKLYRIVQETGREMVARVWRKSVRSAGSE